MVFKKKKICALLVFSWQKCVPKKKLFYLSHITHTHTHTKNKNKKPKTKIT